MEVDDVLTFSKAREMKRSISVSLARVAHQIRDELTSSKTARVITTQPLPAELDEMLRLADADESYLLAQIVSLCNPPELGELSGALLTVYGAKAGGKERLLRWAAARHIAECGEQPETLFRGTSFETKLISLFVNEECRPFVVACLTPLLQWLSQWKGALEVDPARERDAAKLRQHQELLMEAAGRLLTAVRMHLALVPEPVCELLRYVGEQVDARWPGRDMQLRSTGALLFLRLLNPAMVSPEPLVGARTCTPALRRSAILVSKVVQNLANMVLFGEKEDYFAFANEWLRESAQQYQQFTFDCVYSVAHVALTPATAAAQLAAGVERPGTLGITDAARDLALRWVHNFVCVRRKTLLEVTLPELFSGPDGKRQAAAYFAALRRATNNFRCVVQPDMPVAWMTEQGQDKNLLLRSYTSVKESVGDAVQKRKGSRRGSSRPAAEQELVISNPLLLEPIPLGAERIPLPAPAGGAALPATRTKMLRKQSTIGHRLRAAIKPLAATDANAHPAPTATPTSKTRARQAEEDADGPQQMELSTPADGNLSPLKKHKRGGSMAVTTPVNKK